MTKSEPPPQKDDSVLKQLTMFGVVLSQFAGASIAGIGLGWYLWNKQGFPWWTILATSLLGLFAASYQVYRYSRLLQSRGKEGGPR